MECWSGGVMEWWSFGVILGCAEFANSAQGWITALGVRPRFLEGGTGILPVDSVRHRLKAHGSLRIRRVLWQRNNELLEQSLVDNRAAPRRICPARTRWRGNP